MATGNEEIGTGDNDSLIEETIKTDFNKDKNFKMCITFSSETEVVRKDGEAKGGDDIERTLPDVENRRLLEIATGNEGIGTGDNDSVVEESIKNDFSKDKNIRLSKILPPEKEGGRKDMKANGGDDLERTPPEIENKSELEITVSNKEVRTEDNDSVIEEAIKLDFINDKKTNMSVTVSPEKEGSKKDRETDRGDDEDKTPPEVENKRQIDVAMNQEMIKSEFNKTKGLEMSIMFLSEKEGSKKEGDAGGSDEVDRTTSDQVSASDSGVAVSLRSQTGVSESTSIRFERERKIKLGHRRVRSDGQVTYKDILTSRIVSSIQLGIEHAISGLSFRSERDLLMQDFMTVETTPFSSTGSGTTRMAHRFCRFVFKTYAPIAFQHFRQLFGIKPEDFLSSFCRKGLKELPDSGKSGSIFYLTQDDRFIVKTMQTKECSFLQNLLPGYYMNLHQNPDTLLPKYFGLYCYQCDMKKIKLVAMNNILPSSVKISQRYDLKGATYKCRVTNNDTKDNRPPTYKDLDFMLHHPSGLFLENDIYNALMKTIKRDCTVLESFKIMDYSLLLGISKLDSQTQSPESPKKRSTTGRFLTKEDTNMKIHSGESLSTAATYSSSFFSKKSNSKLTVTVKSGDDHSSYLYSSDSFPLGGLPALDGQGEPVLLFIGIIDILQSYKLKKKLEHAWKSVIHDGDTVSVHKPAFYSSRFQKFMSEKVFKRISIPSTKRKPTKQTITKLAPLRRPRDPVSNADSSNENCLYDV